jgi:hypothetical protein
MTRLRSLGLLGWAVCIITIIALAAFRAIYGNDGGFQQAVWFVVYNVIGYVVLFVVFYIREVWKAPGRLLARDVGREVVGSYLEILSQKLGHGGRLLEQVKLRGSTEATLHQFDVWVSDCRDFLRNNLARTEPIFDDLELGPFGPLLELDQFRVPLGPKLTPEQDARNILVDMISRRRANLQRIYEILLPIAVIGELPPRHGSSSRSV